jgi:uncharacterized membrane protein
VPGVRSGDATAFERVYSVIVAGKGLYGLLELFAGSVMLLAPGATSQVLTAVALELAEGSVALRDAAAHALASASAGVTAGAVPLALFLIVHGIVKLLTAYALLRRAIRWYPWALAALGVLLIVQAVDLTIAPSTGAWVLAVLDAVVIALVTWEYRRLRSDGASEVVPVERLGPPDPAVARSRRGSEVPTPDRRGAVR